MIFYAKREWFLSILILLYIMLLIRDPSLLGRTIDFIDYESLAAIISLLLVSRGLELSGIFSRAAPKIVELSGSSDLKLLIFITILVAASSAVIMNDTAIFVFIPLILTISRITGISTAEMVTLTAISANIGSALTPIGNPQNIIIWRTYRISMSEFILKMLSYVMLWIVILFFFLWLNGGKKPISKLPLPKVKIKRRLFFTSLALLITNIMLIEKGYAVFAFIITMILMVFAGKESILSLDVALIAVFTLIFIDFKELAFLLSETSFPLNTTMGTFLLSAGLSQLISNVPTTVLFVSKVKWLPLALGVNLGGNGIISGSLANFIALRISGISLREFHKYSIPYFLIATIATLIVLAI